MKPQGIIYNFFLATLTVTLNTSTVGRLVWIASGHLWEVTSITFSPVLRM